MTTSIKTPTKTDVTVTLQDLEKRLWNAANALRGPVDPADFKTYVFPMLFWKWISDTWEYEHDQAVAEYGDELNEEIEDDFHQFDLPDGTHWSQVTNASSILGAKITKAFVRIEQANPEHLNGIFGDAVWANEQRLPQPALIGLIKAFNAITLNPSTVSHDMLGQGYEYLLKNFADESGKKAPAAVTDDGIGPCGAGGYWGLGPAGAVALSQHSVTAPCGLAVSPSMPVRRLAADTSRGRTDRRRERRC